MIDTKLLRQKILDLAIRGKLVPQNPDDEPASVLLEKIRQEKAALVKVGKIKKDKHESFIFRGEDKHYYEQIDGKTIDITEEIPFDIPETWEWVKLGSIGSILYGVSESAQKNGKYKLLRITDIQDDSVDWNNVPFTNYEGDASAYFLEKNDIVFARTGATVGKSYILDEFPAHTIYASYLIRVRFVAPMVASYVKVFFGSKTYWQEISEKSVGTGQSNVNGTSLANLLIPFPPLQEQHNIVNRIESLLVEVDKIDKNSTDLESALSLAKQKVLDLAIRGKLVPQNPEDEPASELLKRIKAEKEALVKAGKIKRDRHESYIFRGDDNRYFENINGKTVDITEKITFELPKNWAWCRLRNLGEIVGGGTPSTDNAKYWDNGDVAWLSPADLTGYTQKYILHGKKNITQFGLLNSSAKLMPAGSVLYSSRAPIGYVVISSGEISTNQGFKSIVPAITECNEFLYYYLKAATPEIKSRATGTTFKEISGNEFGATLVPLPPIAEQKSIVSQVEKIFSMLETMQE